MERLNKIYSMVIVMLYQMYVVIATSYMQTVNHLETIN